MHSAAYPDMDTMKYAMLSCLMMPMSERKSSTAAIARNMKESLPMALLLSVFPSEAQ